MLLRCILFPIISYFRCDLWFSVAAFSMLDRACSSRLHADPDRGASNLVPLFESAADAAGAQ